MANKDFEKALTLTKKEIEVMGLMSEGLTDEQIAEKTFISVTTLKTHKHNIYNKLCLQDEPKGIKRIKTVLYYLQNVEDLVAIHAY